METDTATATAQARPGQGLEWGIVLGFLAVGACGAYGTGHLDLYRGVSRT